jgi:hypothetical protein
MMTFKYLRRTVSITHEHGNLRVWIADSRRWNKDTIGRLMILAVWTFVVLELIAPLRHLRWSAGTAYFLVFLALFLVVYLILLWIFLWKAFGTEEILVKDGVMRWTCKVLWFKDEVDFGVSGVSDVKAITPWYGRNRVEFTAQGRRYHLFKTFCMTKQWSWRTHCSTQLAGIRDFFAADFRRWTLKKILAANFANGRESCENNYHGFISLRASH